MESAADTRTSTPNAAHAYPATDTYQHARAHLDARSHVHADGNPCPYRHTLTVSHWHTAPHPHQ